MKILKPGRVEKRKFTCSDCGCVFVAMPGECEFGAPLTICCPQVGCGSAESWLDGEPYEEAKCEKIPDRDRLFGLLVDCGLGFDSKSEVYSVADYLIVKGVTFREG